MLACLESLRAAALSRNQDAWATGCTRQVRANATGTTLHPGDVTFAPLQSTMGRCIRTSRDGVYMSFATVCCWPSRVEGHRRQDGVLPPEHAVGAAAAYRLVRHIQGADWLLRELQRMIIANPSCAPCVGPVYVRLYGSSRVVELLVSLAQTLAQELQYFLDRWARICLYGCRGHRTQCACHQNAERATSCILSLPIVAAMMCRHGCYCNAVGATHHTVPQWAVRSITCDNTDQQRYCPRRVPHMFL